MTLRAVWVCQTSVRNRKRHKVIGIGLFDGDEMTINSNNDGDDDKYRKKVVEGGVDNTAAIEPVSPIRISAFSLQFLW